MRQSTLAAPRRDVTASALAFPGVAHPSPATDYRQYLRAHLNLRPILGAGCVWGLILALYVFLAAPAQAGSARGHELPPRHFNAAACYQLVHNIGRMIAWARWEEGFSLEKTRSAQFRDGTPPWVIDLVHGWITDAYEWQATDEQIREWAGEMGDVASPPHAGQLDARQSIRLWIWRITRRCDLWKPAEEHAYLQGQKSYRLGP